MSGIQPSAHDNGVVETVLGIVVGVVVIGLGVYLWGDRAGSEGALAAFGVGGVIALMSGYQLVSRLSDLETRDPVVIIRTDLNDWEDIRWELIKTLGTFGLFMGFYEFVMRPRFGYLPLMALPSEAPIFVAAWVGMLVLAILLVMFRSYRGGSRRIA